MIVTLKDNRRLYGYPEYYSPDPDEGTLYLLDPSWVKDDNTLQSCGINGIFLTQKESIKWIEFLKNEC